MKSTQSAVLFFLTLLLVGCSNRRVQEQTDLEKLNLKGDVKSLKIYSPYLYEVPLDSLPYQIFEFNIRGFGISEASVNPISGQRVTRTLERDNSDYLEVATTTDVLDNVLKTETYYYDGDLLRSITVESGDETTEFKYEYYENDSIKKIENFINGELVVYITHEYGTVSIEKTTTLFNVKDGFRLESLTSLDSSNKVMVIQTRLYNENRSSESPISTSKYQFFLDQNNNIELQITYGKNGAMGRIAYEYEYDHLNNWTLQKVFHDDSLVHYITREIEYY